MALILMFSVVSLTQRPVTMAFQSMEEAKNKFTRLFQETDVDKSGNLSLDEFKSMLLKSGYQYTESELEVRLA